MKHQNCFAKTSVSLYSTVRKLRDNRQQLKGFREGPRSCRMTSNGNGQLKEKMPVDG